MNVLPNITCCPSIWTSPAELCVTAEASSHCAMKAPAWDIAELPSGGFRNPCANREDTVRKTQQMMPDDNCTSPARFVFIMVAPPHKYMQKVCQPQENLLESRIKRPAIFLNAWSNLWHGVQN